ncbi:MAG: PH domain-containing protein [Rubrivivax sp.]|nr:PH domain-containing protein [Rubrivivax sp.]
MTPERKTTRPLEGHRHTPPGQHEHEYEPQYGLPELLPRDEHILWQGTPDWKAVALRRFHVRKLAIYFVVLLAARVAALVSDGMPLLAALSGTAVLSSVAAAALAGLVWMAWYSSRTTVYTLTDKRVVMRIGIALTLSLNLPLKRIESADLGLGAAGIGDIALKLREGDRVAFVHLWPHARRWRFARPEPTLLCLPDAQAVAARLTQAWAAVHGASVLNAAAPAAPARAVSPALATR